MFLMKNFDLKLSVLQVFVICTCLAFLLASCDVTTSCGLQAVAGGAKYCEETSLSRQE